MTPFRADLHCHSTCSDGTLTPVELIHHAKEVGLSGLSITDHDTIEAYATAIPEADRLGISLLTGVEFSTMHENTPVHILGYGFDLTHSSIRQFCNRHTKRRQERNREILALLAKEGMPISEEEISTEPHTVGRPHIALALVKHGHVASFQEAFNRYIGDGKPCHARGNPFTVAETIEVIHEGGGLAVIAHPHLIDNSRTVREILKMPFDGIECHYGRFTPKQNRRWIDIANEKRWLITGGSDFHGAIKPSIPLGCSWVPEETFHTIKQKTWTTPNS